MVRCLAGDIPQLSGGHFHGFSTGHARDAGEVEKSKRYMRKWGVFPQHAILLFGAAFVGGLINSVAGGGGFIVFPALLFTGIPPVSANATNTVALWPGTAASTFAYREDLMRVKSVLLPLALTGISGGVVGALVLLRTPQATFMRLVPWLILGATLLFAFSSRLTRRLGISDISTTKVHATRVLWVASGIQFLVSIYIGYFGAGAGILMLATFALMGIQGIHTMNGLKSGLASIVNGVAVITFMIAKAIMWPQAMLMVTGAAIGGYGGAYYARKIDARLVRGFVIATGIVLTTYFFFSNYRAA